MNDQNTMKKKTHTHSTQKRPQFERYKRAASMVEANNHMH